MEELNRVVHQWCDSNDRWMYIEYDRDGKVMGLNFMQGDEYECFKKDWCVSDQGLTAFYKQMLYLIHKILFELICHLFHRRLEHLRTPFLPGKEVFHVPLL